MADADERMLTSVHAFRAAAGAAIQEVGMTTKRIAFALLVVLAAMALAALNAGAPWGP